MKQGKKNIAISIAAFIIIVLLIMAILIMPSLMNKYAAYKLINNTFNKENICTEAHIDIESETESFVFDVDFNMSRIDNKCLFYIGNNDYNVYYYDNKLVFSNMRALSFDFVKPEASFNLNDLYFLFDIKGGQGVYEIDVDVSRLNNYLSEKVNFDDISIKLFYDDDQIKSFIVYLSGSYENRNYKINMTLNVKDSKDFVPENLKNMIIDNSYELIGTINEDTVKLINAFIRLIQRDYMVYDIDVSCGVEMLNINKKMTFYQSSEGSIYESGGSRLYFLDGKTINSDGEIIAYTSEPFKIEATFKVIYNILINGNFESNDSGYSFVIDERGISDLISIFLEDENINLADITNAQMNIVLKDDSISRIEFDLYGRILKVFDANISMDVDIEYNGQFSFPEYIKKSLSLDKE